MAATIKNQYDISKPTPAEVALARVASEALTRGLVAKSTESISVRLDDGAGESITIPASALRLLKNILAEMAEGNAVAVMPVDSELTTQQAAKLLNVSRSFLIDLLEKELIPYHKVGSHRRMTYADVMAYKRDIDTKRLAELEELTALGQKWEMGY